jgi:hypothetical protein
MKDKEDHENDVEIMSVEKKLKEFSPNFRNGCNP